MFLFETHEWFIILIRKKSFDVILNAVWEWQMGKSASHLFGPMQVIILIINKLTIEVVLDVAVPHD